MTFSVVYKTGEIYKALQAIWSSLKVYTHFNETYTEANLRRIKSYYR